MAKKLTLSAIAQIVLSVLRSRFPDIRSKDQFRDFGIDRRELRTLVTELNELPAFRQRNLQISAQQAAYASDAASLAEILYSNQSSGDGNDAALRTGPSVATPYETAPRGGNVDYTVWYGTNRMPVRIDGNVTGYSAHRDDDVHFGACKVFIPESHKIGSIGSPFWRRALQLRDDRLKLREVNELEIERYWSSLSEALSQIPKTERHAVVFIHGFNVSFESAALRAAQIGFDLSVGAMAFFSWPSRGTLKGYPADAASIEASEHFITKFLTDFCEKSNAQTVHIIAHSMGNRGLLRAMQRIVETARKGGKRRTRFGQIILAAPDVDTDVFRDLCGVYRRVCKRATLYVSQKDNAVRASRALYDGSRVGFAPPIFTSPNIDTVNVTAVDVTLLGHSYVAQARPLLSDIHQLIVDGLPPSRRFGLRPTEERGARYWIMGR